MKPEPVPWGTSSTDEVITLRICAMLVMCTTDGDTILNTEIVLFSSEPRSPAGMVMGRDS